MTFYNVRFYGKFSVCAQGGTTNRVLGTLRSTGAGFNSVGDSQDMQVSTPSAWFTTGVKNATFAVEGDIYFSNEENLGKDKMGGSGTVCLCGDKDQIIHIEGGYLPTLTIDKPQGTKVTCDIDEDKPLIIDGIGSNFNPHFVLHSGTFVMPKAGLLFSDARWSNFYVRGGVVENKEAPVEFRVIDSVGIYIDIDYPLRDFKLSGGKANITKPLSIIGDIEIGEKGQFAVGSSDRYLNICGSGDQRYKNTSGINLVESGSSNYGHVRLNKPSGKLYLENPLRSKFVKFESDSHLVFSVTNATSQVSSIGDGGWNTPVVKANSRELQFSSGVNITLEVAGKLNGASPTKWNMFSWVHALKDYESCSFDFILPPGASKPKLVKDDANKNIFLQYRYASGMKVIVR